MLQVVVTMSVIIERDNSAALCGVSELYREVMERFPVRNMRREYALRFVKSFKFNEGNPRFYTARNDADELVGVMNMTMWVNLYGYGIVARQRSATSTSSRGEL